MKKMSYENLKIEIVIPATNDIITSSPAGGFDGPPQNF